MSSRVCWKLTEACSQLIFAAGRAGPPPFFCFTGLSRRFCPPGAVAPILPADCPWLARQGIDALAKLPAIAPPGQRASASLGAAGSIAPASLSDRERWPAAPPPRAAVRPCAGPDRPTGSGPA
jgi:hypothetical protein